MKTSELEKLKSKRFKLLESKIFGDLPESGTIVFPKQSKK